MGRKSKYSKELKLRRKVAISIATLCANNQQHSPSIHVLQKQMN